MEQKKSKSISELMQQADRCLGFERCVATLGEQVQLHNNRTMKVITLELKEPGKWEEVH